MRDTTPNFRLPSGWYDIFHVVPSGCCRGLISFSIPTGAQRRAPSGKKIEWILWGLSFGPTLFFLVILPELFNHKDIIPRSSEHFSSF